MAPDSHFRWDFQSQRALANLSSERRPEGLRKDLGLYAFRQAVGLLKNAGIKRLIVAWDWLSYTRSASFSCYGISPVLIRSDIRAPNHFYPGPSFSAIEGHP